MRFIRRAVAAFRARPKRQLHELNDWMLAILGSLSFLIAGYWSLVVADVLPSLINLTNHNGLTRARAVIFVFLGTLGVSIWFFGCLAARCHSLLFERHFR